jgi:hypothetical protein
VKRTRQHVPRAHVVGFEPLCALKRRSSGPQEPGESPRENPVNQSGSVALSAEEVRGPPQRNTLINSAISA